MNQNPNYFRTHSIVSLILLSLLIYMPLVMAETVTGTLEVVWGDGKPQSNKPSKVSYSLAKDNGSKLPLKIKQAVISKAGGLSKIKGKKVIVDIPDFSSKNGALSKQNTVVKSLKLAPSPSNSIDSASYQASYQQLAGPQKYVSILCKFADFPNATQGLSFFQDMYGNSPGQLGHYWKEVSSNKIDMSGSSAHGDAADPDGWYVLPSNKDAYVNTANPHGDLTLLFNDCVAAADADIDFTDVKGINLMFNTELGDYAWGGGEGATLDGVTKYWPTTWEPDWAWSNVSVMAHEIGHSFGLPHSNNSDGDSDPYDSPWTVMSADGGLLDAIYGARGQHFNAYEKETMEWLDTSEIAIVEENSSLTLELDSLSLSQAKTGAYRSIKIPFLDGTGYYTLETRLKTGEYEAALPGEAVIIHSVVPGRSEPSWVVDADTPPADYADTESNMWKVGETFKDLANNVEVYIESRTDNGFQVSVNRFPRPHITSPQEGSTLSGAFQTFTWTDNGSAVTLWYLLVGSQPGLDDIHSYSGTDTSTIVLAPPQDGSRVYVQLLYKIDDEWSIVSTDYLTLNNISQCPSGEAVNVLTNDDFENGLGSWTHAATQGLDAWNHSTSNPAEGLGHIHGDNYDSTSDSHIRSNSSVTLPANAFLSFNHSYNFEEKYDGGVVEYSQDGTSWNDAESLFIENGYNWLLDDFNPLGAVRGFSSTSSGYVTSKLDLSSLVGNNINFRFRIGSDYIIGADGWDIDNVQIYTCNIAPKITSPVSGATLTDTSQEFTIDNSGVDVEYWWLRVGSTLGGNEITSTGGEGSLTSVTIDNLPQDGSPIYIRLRYKEDGVWKTSYDYLYYASTPSPKITSPTSGATLSGASQVFTLDDIGIDVEYWWLRVGTTLGENDIAAKGGDGSLTNITVDNLPTDGSPIFVRLRYKQNGVWKTGNDYEYVSGNSLPSITSPVSGGTLSGATQVFTVDKAGSNVEYWWLRVGTTVGGKEIAARGGVGSLGSITIDGLPIDGSPIFARLLYKEGGVWKTASDYEYTAANLPAITSPVVGEALSGMSQTFVLDNVGIDVEYWWLRVGTTIGGQEITARGGVGSLESVTIEGLPIDGSTVYVRLLYKEGGAWKTANDYEYTAANLPAITSPVVGETLSGVSQVFTLDNVGTDVEYWWLRVGTTIGGQEITARGGVGSLESVTIEGLPTDGSTVFVRLLYKEDGVWKTANDYEYMAIGIPAITSPVAGTTLSGDTQVFTVDNSGIDVEYWWLRVGTTVGGKEITARGGVGSLSSVTINGLPLDGSTVFVRLMYQESGVWKIAEDYTYTAEL